jgi:hypothetical protein
MNRRFWRRVRQLITRDRPLADYLADPLAPTATIVLRVEGGPTVRLRPGDTLRVGHTIDSTQAGGNGRTANVHVVSEVPVIVEAIDP